MSTWGLPALGRFDVRNGHGDVRELRRPRSKPYLACVIAVALGLATLLAGPTRAQGSSEAGSAIAASGKTIGLVLANIDWLFYKTQGGKEECPAGFRYSDRDNWEAEFPTQAARKKQLNRCGDFQNRGPNCENVWFTPEAIKDPLPFRGVTGKISYGVHLGAAAGNTCPHEEFTSPEGETGIDNQYYRFLGCGVYQRDNFPEKTMRVWIKQNSVLRWLLEIDGVNSKQGDGAVEVTLSRGKDPLIVDAAGKALPWQSQRIDENAPPESVYHLHGKMVNGVITTEPTDIMWVEWMAEPRLLIRGMTLRIHLTPTGAEVLRVGYIDVEQLWHGFSQYGSTMGTVVGASGPSTYAALHQLADGYKDPTTGACTALSSARKYEFVRAHVIHPSAEANP
jgi:hypothetical protein